MQEEDLAEIRELPLFRGMAQDNLEQMLRAAYAQDFPAQLQLFSQGGRADFLHVLISGNVALSTGWKGREAVMMIMRPVSTFILAACMLELPLLMSGRTLTNCRIALIPAVDARWAFRADPAFADAASQRLSLGFRQMVEHAKDLKLRKSHERLAAWLHERWTAAGCPERLELELEKRVLASFLGMTPESLSRSFRALVEHGVRIEGPHVLITDPERLRQVATEDDPPAP